MESIYSSIEDQWVIADGIAHFKKLLKDEDPIDVNLKLESGYTLLNTLWRYYKDVHLIDLVKLMVKKDADVNTKERLGSTPLHSLCYNYENDMMVIPCPSLMVILERMFVPFHLGRRDRLRIWASLGDVERLDHWRHCTGCHSKKRGQQTWWQRRNTVATLQPLAFNISHNKEAIRCIFVFAYLAFLQHCYFFCRN